MKGTIIKIEKGLGPYTSCVRTSFYVDGSEEDVKIACDLYLPLEENGEAVSEPLPMILHAGMGDRRAAEIPEITFTLVANGYAHMFCDVRVEGASRGVSHSFAGMDQANDMKCVIEWAAAQPWCNGKVAMRGISNKGFIQLTTACTFPPHLVAITPAVCNADFYYVNQPNGVNGSPKLTPMPSAFSLPSTDEIKIGTPVDDDPAPWYPMARANAKYRADKVIPWYERENPENKCRDWIDPNLGYAPNIVDAPIEYVDKLREHGCMIQQFAGWFDSNASGQLMFHNLVGHRIIVGPWNHGETISGRSKLEDGTLNFAREHLDWFDECLKGKPAKRPKITYYTMNAPKGSRWKESDVWPPKDCRQIPFYLESNGRLQKEIPDVGKRSYTVTDDVTVFDPWGRFDTNITRDMNIDCDSKAMTFTTELLLADTELTGHCVCELYVASTATDGIFMAIIEDISPDGSSKYITSGTMRATHRKESPNEAFNRVGVPYHRSFEADLMPLEPGVPTRLAFCVDATSYFFPAGDRIRMTITCGEKTQMQQPACIDLNNPPKVTLFTGGDKANRVLLSLKVPEA